MNFSALGCAKGKLTVMQIALTILQVICALAVMAIVLFQSGKSAGLSGAISGVADTFLSKNKDRSFDAKLAKATKWVAIAFVVLTLLLNIIG
jgi:preprotein translocase subunit SecG